MKAHTSTFKENIKTLGREIDSKITYELNGETIELGKEQLNSITPHYEADILKSVMKQLDVDSNEDIPVGTEINYQFGLKVGNSYEYLDYGNYIIYSSEKQEDTRSYKIVAYDKMLYAMKDYQAPVSKNLLNINTFVMGGMTNGNLTTSGFRITNANSPIEVEPDTTYTLSVILSNDVLGMRVGVHECDENLVFKKDNGWKQLATTGYTFTTRSDTKYVKMVFSLSTTSANVTTGGTENTTNYTEVNEWIRGTNFQFEKGNQATSYNPFFEYPITIKNYLTILADNIGLTLKDTNFVNYDKELTSELYLDSDGNSLNYTYRDVLDEIAGATASTICINDNDELEVRYVKEYKLPRGYSELDYIENTSNQYIDTGIIPDENTKINIDFMYLSSYITNWNPIFGERGNVNTTYFAMFIQPSSLRLSPNYAGFDPGASSNTSIEANTKYNFRNEKGKWYINDELKSGMSTTNTLVQGDKSIYLFGMNPSRFGTLVRIYRCKFYENETLVRDFIPALRTSDNEIGMYDIVNDVFYTNQGTGDFIYGEVINESVDEIDEEYLKDINVNFGEKYGPVNSIVFSRSAESDNIYRQDTESVEANGLQEIKIIDNQILNSNNRDEFIDGVFNQLNGFSYYANDFVSTGITYYDLCDRYNVKVEDNIYSCVMLNDEILITQGLEENIHTDIPEDSETDYKKADKTDRRINQAYIIVDKQNQEINSVVQTISEVQNLVNENNEQVEALGTRLTQTTDGLTASITSLQDEIDSGVGLVKTTMVTIDDSGLNVSTDTSKISTTMTNDAFTINSSDKQLAFFGYDTETNSTRAQMDNLTITNYLTAGYHRIEKFERNGEQRTGYFYIGGR